MISVNSTLTIDRAIAIISPFSRLKFQVMIFSFWKEAILDGQKIALSIGKVALIPLMFNHLNWNPSKLNYLSHEDFH